MAIIFNSSNQSLIGQLIEFADSLKITHTEITFEDLSNCIALPGCALSSEELSAYLDKCEKSDYLSKVELDEFLRQWK
jgi:hypothetical protein